MKMTKLERDPPGVAAQPFTFDMVLSSKNANSFFKNMALLFDLKTLLLSQIRITTGR